MTAQSVGVFTIPNYDGIYKQIYTYQWNQGRCHCVLPAKEVYGALTSTCTGMGTEVLCPMLC